MNRGPKQRPKVVAISAGARASSINHAEPELPPAAVAGDLPPPPTLDPVATEEWQRAAPILLERGVLSVGDMAVFEAYCTAWGRFVAARNTVARAAHQAARERAAAVAWATAQSRATAEGREPTPAEEAAARAAQPTSAQVAEAQRNGLGLLYRNTHGNLAPNPILGVMNQAEKNLLQCAAELGLTPSSRARVKAEKKKSGGPDPWSEFATQ